MSASATVFHNALNSYVSGDRLSKIKCLFIACIAMVHVLSQPKSGTCDTVIHRKQHGALQIIFTRAEDLFVLGSLCCIR